MAWFLHLHGVPEHFSAGGLILRAIFHLAMAGYCLAIYAVLDLAYSAYLHDEGLTPRIADPVYHHTLVPNFDGYNNWGDTRFKLYTNSLGFRDAAVRDVPASSSMHRVLLIGDSFTEGLGVNFEDSFAGMLYWAGIGRASKIEFLDAGVIAYSPVLYYQKTKSYLDRGLRFDEVIVFSDPSEVRDEASEYFAVMTIRATRNIVGAIRPTTFSETTWAPPWLGISW
jgi:hypothetical protein